MIKRVFPRLHMALMCQKCSKPAGVQGGKVALCWEHYEELVQQRAHYKEDLGKRFNACFTNFKKATDDEEAVTFLYDDDEDSYWDYEDYAYDD